MAKSMPARCSSLAMAWVTFLFLSSKRPGAADPVEVLVPRRGRRAVDDLDALELVGPVGPLALAHAPRVAGVLHRPVGVAQLGREVRLHQRQVAPHVEDLVEDLDVDRADLVARLAGRAGPHLLGGDALEDASRPTTVISASTPMGGDTGGVPVRAMTSPVLSTISRGSSGLPVACAGHTEVQRPHMVQASVSSSCFQVKSSMVEAPKLSSSVSMRFGMGFMAPLGRSRSFRYMFSGDVNMWRSIVTGRITRKAKKRERRGAIHQRLVPAGEVVAAVDEPRQRVADERPLLEVGPARRRRCGTPRRRSR